VKTWRQGVTVELRLASGSVVRARCLKYPLLRVLTEPPTDVFVRRAALGALVRVGEAPLTSEERRAGEGWTYLSETAGVVGDPPAGIRPVLVDPTLVGFGTPPPAPVRADRLTDGLKLILEETFLRHRGMFTNRGTSLFETLATVDAAEASRPHGPEGETVAGHVFHMKFYLEVARDSLVHPDRPPADWSQSWVVRSVTEPEWAALKRALRDEYETLVAFVDGVADWTGPDHVVGLLGILAHNAFHLGAVRELLTPA